MFKGISLLSISVFALSMNAKVANSVELSLLKPYWLLKLYFVFVRKSTVD